MCVAQSLIVVPTRSNLTMMDHHCTVFVDYDDVNDDDDDDEG